MNKETRIQRIQEIISQEPFGKQEIPWQDQLVTMNVYKIPLAYLIYNKYNGRILSRTKSLESQKHNIDVETDEGKKKIEELLWKSKPEANKKTEESIRKFGQEKIGIITKDGIVIDGNRRVMILNRISTFDYFKAVILPVTLDENPLEIEKLETTFQMGEDKKLSYNATEKYLKAKGLVSRSVSIDKIADWMGEAESKVEEYIDVMKTMDEYLEYFGYDNIYTQLDGREDQFISLTNWLNTFYGENSQKGFDGYKDSDVDDLKVISFDYIRAKYTGGEKRFRNIAQGLKENHFFGNKEIWKDFCDFHFKNIQPIKDEEEPIDFDSADLTAHLNGRDEKFIQKAISLLDDNIDTHFTQLRYNKASEEPEKLVNDASRALKAIDQKHKSFSEPRVLKQLEELNQTVTNMFIKKSPERLLSQVIDMLEAVKFDKTQPKEELLEKVSKINKISFDMKKSLGG